MTTKVLIVNHGPDLALVRTVRYGPDVQAVPGAGAEVIDDNYLAPQESKQFYIHRNQQLLIGEKQSRMEIESKEAHVPSGS